MAGEARKNEHRAMSQMGPIATYPAHPPRLALTFEPKILLAALLVAAGTISAVHRCFGGHRRQMPLYGYYIHGQYVPGVRDTLIYGPGYVFVPGHGILGEDCDMPTSTCSNEYRAVK